MGPEKREEIIVQMAAGIVRAYRYFRPHRRRLASTYGAEPPRSPGKIGRNERVRAVPGKNISAAAAV